MSSISSENTTRATSLALAPCATPSPTLLFPGTSTIMIRARYFLLVPWAYQRLERLRVRSAEIAARARQAELNLVEPIERSDDNDGNIGKLAKTTLKRLASSVYWQGLSVWEIRSFENFSSTINFMRYLDRRRVLRKSYVRKPGSARTVLNRLMKLWALESQAARALPSIR